jgi:hypothetical protein
MSSELERDDLLWKASQADHCAFDCHEEEWKFSRHFVYIGEKSYALSSEQENQASLELALFDVHWTYWHWRARTVDQGSIPPNFKYHNRLRQAIQNHFQECSAGGKAIKRPEFLQPWIWRTFCLCHQGLAGRQTFLDIAKSGRIFDRANNLKACPTPHSS